MNNVHRSRILVVSLLALILAAPVRGKGEMDRDDQLQPLVTTAELTVGTNRFAFGLLKTGKLIEQADVMLRLFAIDGSGPTLAAQTKVPYFSVKTIDTQPSIHRHADGTTHVHDSDSAVRGLYVTQLQFAHAGNWGIELRASENGSESDVVRFAVTVQDNSPIPAIGAPAPRSRNLTVRDVKNLREIDTSPKPDRRLHEISIADAIAASKPQLVVFATPQFCTSRMCGPVVDIVRTLLPKYGKQLAFIHQEIWQDFATKKAFATVDEWRLVTEPWIFLVDGEGIVRARFEGLVTTNELEQAIQLVLLKQTARQ